jgi:TatD DNase family protein
MSDSLNFIDSHCHLHFDDYLPDFVAVIKDAAAHKVTKMVCVGVNLADSQKAVDLASKQKNIWAAVGVHPHDAGNFLGDPNSQDKLSKLIKSPKVVAIGEIGLDYFKDYSPRDVQQKALRVQIEAGLPSGLPFVFHVREAFDDFWEIVDSYKEIRGVVHSFSAHAQQLEEILKRNFYVGLNGIMTFTKDEQQLEAAKKIPLNKLMLETDAPFLTPKPHRGQRCEPKHVVLTAEFLANLRIESIQELANATTINAQELLGI